jgi:hypothetical protein
MQVAVLAVTKADQTQVAVLVAAGQAAQTVSTEQLLTLQATDLVAVEQEIQLHLQGVETDQQALLLLDINYALV